MYDRTQARVKTKKKSLEVIVNGKTWNKESIKNLILTNDKAVYRALLLLYSFQTEEEKYLEVTKTVNGKGFNKLDTEQLSSFARQILGGKHLTQKQLYVARYKLVKYSNQILLYMKEREENKITLN